MSNSAIPQSGFYIIRLSDTHYYGGRSKNVHTRWQRHLGMLKKNHHPNAYMQAVFNKYNQQFEPELVHEVNDPKELCQIEQDWLNQHFGQPGCVNISISAQYNPDFKQTCKTLSDRARERFSDPKERAKMSVLQKGVPKSAETKAKMSSVWKDTHHWSPELKALWSEQRLGKRRSEQARANISSGLRGHKVSPETRAKISAANKAYHAAHPQRPDSIFWVYVIQSQEVRTGKNGKILPGFHYVGCTTDPARRIKQHNGLLSGGGKYTAKHRKWVPRALYGPYNGRSNAMKAEYALKHGKRGTARTRWSVGDSPWCCGKGPNDPWVTDGIPPSSILPIDEP